MNLPPEEPYIYPAEQRDRRPVVAPTGINWGCALALSLMLLGIAAVAWITLFPRTPKMSTKIMLKAIEIALKGYQTEYNRCLLDEMQLPGDQNLVFEGEILSALVAESTKYNPRRVRFFDPPVARRKKGGAWRDESGTLQYRDDRGNPVMIRYDADGDDKVLDPDDNSSQLLGRYMLFTAGMDRDLSTTQDNLKSWH